MYGKICQVCGRLVQYPGYGEGAGVVVVACPDCQAVVDVFNEDDPEEEEIRHG